MSLTLSLLMPTRNRASYLAAGVAHFLAINREDVELIVVDASDDHAEALTQLAPWLDDSRLRLVDNTTHTVGRVSNMAQNWAVALDKALSERPFSIAGVSSRSDSYAVRNGEHRQAAHARWMGEAGSIDGWGATSDLFYFSLPMAVMGFRNAFCSSFAVNVNINLNHFLETCQISLQSQEDQVSFDQQKQDAVAFLTRHFGQDFGFGLLQRQTRPAAHYGGLAGELLVIPHSVFNGDMKAFARVAFGLVRPVAHMFNDATVGDVLP
jgi:hypothetical protein